MSTEQSEASGRRTILVLGILLIAANLRGPITGIAPLLGMIQETTGIGTAQIGALTTLPLLAFAVMSPFAVLLARAWGIERSLFAALLLIAAGVAVRSLGPVWCLFAGTTVIGVGVAIGNVLLPGLIKRDFPDRIGEMTSAYALTAGLAAAAASALAVPAAGGSSEGWPLALAGFVVVPLAAAVVWLPQLRNHTAPSGAATAASGQIWRSALAWQVTFFVGLVSLVYYVVAAWLPAILVESGYSEEAAGSLHGVSQAATAVSGLVFGPIIGRMKDQRPAAVGVSALTALSLAGLWLVPQWALVWTALFGFGMGSAFIFGLSFVSLRAPHAQQAAALSGMAQCVGYSLAAAGPPLAGLAHDYTGSWALPLGLCIAGALLMCLFGQLAGRARHI